MLKSIIDYTVMSHQKKSFYIIYDTKKLELKAERRDMQQCLFSCVDVVFMTSPQVVKVGFICILVVHY